MPGLSQPDGVLLILDSTHLERHLMLAARVIALGLPTLVLLNMADELKKQGGHVDVLLLAKQLGTPVALISATSGAGIEAISAFVSSHSEAPSPLAFQYWQTQRSAANGRIRSVTPLLIGSPYRQSGRNASIPCFSTASGDPSSSQSS